MEAEKILEGNKLIAEFMGLPITGTENFFLYCEPDGREVEYHSSWGWLMPVVIKSVHLMSSDCCFIGDGYLKKGHFQFAMFSGRM